ncbi:hypothetical protein WJX72_008711 [[Myrmecia] bisecta]|uniref:DNA (cytosine-5-)-methyltransferase n=1 Tax=[Myrmecia] bisecta TaxID=41462 RepID=A0AAW1Q7V3_9CHLO
MAGPLNYIDLFAGGIGAWSYGLSQCGMRHLVGIELNKQAAEAYRANHGPCLQVDISTVTAETLAPYLQGRRCNVLAASPPCQGFSSQGNRDPADPRNHLYMHVVRLTDALKPDFVLMENVRGLASMKHPATGELYIKTVQAAFAAVGYDSA